MRSTFFQRVFRFTVLLWTATLTLWAEEGRPILRNYEPSETGGTPPYYWTTVQDERGVLYFGCDVVLSFDGQNWQQYPVPGSYAVRALAVGQDGRLWAGAVNEIGYFDRLPTGTLSAYHSLVPMLPPGTGNLGDVWSVFARGQDAVFVTSDSVLVWNGRTFRIDRLPGARRLVATEVNGQIYISHLLKGVFVLDGDILRPFISPVALDNASSFWMEPTADGWLLATTAGLGRYVNGRFSFFAPDASAYIRQHTITSTVRLPQGDICVSTLTGGLVVVTPSGEIERTITEKDGLPTDDLTALFVAQDGAVWVSSYLGVSRVALDAAVSTFGQRENLKGRRCDSIAQMGENLLVATDNGIFGLPIGPDSNSRFQPFGQLQSISRRELTTAGDSVYAAGFKGIDRLQDGRLTHVFSTKQDVLLLSPSLKQPGTFLASDGFELVRLRPDASGDLQATRLTQLPDFAISIAEDASGTVWVGTNSRGVFYLRHGAPGAAVPFKTADGAPVAGRGLVAQVGPSVAICTDGGVVLCRDPSSPRVPVAGAPGTAPVAISNPDAQGRVWLAFPSPFADGERVAVVGRLSVDHDGAGRWVPFALPGLATAGAVTRLFVDQRGILWIGGTDGLLRLDPRRLEPVTAPRVPVIRSSVADGASLPWSHNTATLDFGTVEFGRPASVRFQTRLSTGAGAWSDPTANSHLALAGLRDGDYAFDVRVINDAGLVSPPATWRFAVLPPWYRTNYAYALWGLLGLGACFGLIQWRSAYLRQRNLRLEALVRQKTQQLEKANAAKSEFLANMSHEIRNPISGIVGLSIAIEDTPLDGRQQQLVNSIRSCASLLATLVDDVLDFSKIEAGKIELRPAPFDLRAALEQCTAMVAEEIRDTGGSIALTIDPELPPRVVGDSARVQQIVLNYLTNALKFGPGKPIVVGAAPAAPGCLQLFVKDQGPGMTEAEAAALFTKFTRLERARTGGIRGTGLGLAVCRLLATKMGGTVGVDSRPGEGSCFWAELPLPAAPESAVPADAAPVSSVPLRALIVEDIDYNGIAMQAVLRKLGIDSDIVTDGPGALARLLNSTYDVVFMDWNLPGMIGTEVVARYRAIEPASRRTIIIATTAYSEEMNREACLQAGMDAFISKPFTPAKIAAALADLRESRRAAASVEINGPAEAGARLASLDLQFLQFAGDGTPDGLRVAIGRYLAAFHQDLSAARHALAEGPAAFVAVAHRLGSHAKFVHAEALIRIAAELESNGALSAAEKERLLDEFEREFALVRDTLDSIRASGQPA